MDNPGYVTLTRQSGLLKELAVTANNIANSATRGFRAEGVVFAEMIRANGDAEGSISMTDARVRYTSTRVGVHTKTGGTFDVALEGQGYFQIETENGIRLSRNGAFSTNEQSELVTMDGYRVLDAGGAPIFIPPDRVGIKIGPDGTISSLEGPISTIGIVDVEDPTELLREDGVFFSTNGALLPADNTRVRQGFLEDSNVDPVREISRLIEVQRAYELGQKLLEKEDERIRGVVRTLGSQA